MRPFFGIITPTVDHQINELGPHFHRGQVWAEWRVVMPHDTMDNFCITKGTKKIAQYKWKIVCVQYDTMFHLSQGNHQNFLVGSRIQRLLQLMFSVCFCFQVVCCFFVHKCSLLTRGWESFSDKGPDFYHQRIFLKIPKVSDDSKRPATNLFSQK